MVSSQQPLANVRVLDFSWSVAGPLMTRNLAALGADIIKVEWPRRPDPMRKAMYRVDEKFKTLNNGVFFANLNIGKRSLTLNMRDAVGLSVAKRLISACDIIVESFAAGVFAGWGLTFDVLRQLRPDVIYLSASGFGHTGEYAQHVSWGPTAQAFNGLTFMSGIPDSPPAGWGYSYQDIVAGQMGTIALLAALHMRERGGPAQHIDLAQVETGLPLAGAAHLDFQVNGRPTRRGDFPPGNRTDWPSSIATAGHGLGFRGESGAPYNAYRTAGDGHYDWCVINVLEDEQWRSLVELMGSPNWALQQGMETRVGRVRHQAQIDAELEKWAQSHSKYELMHMLQRAGVPAAAVQSPEDRLENDPQLKFRDIYPSIDHPELGRQRFEALPIQFSAADRSPQNRWPDIGEHTDEILRELLHMPADEVDALRRAGILWPEGVDVTVTIERALW